MSDRAKTVFVVSEGCEFESCRVLAVFELGGDAEAFEVAWSKSNGGIPVWSEEVVLNPILPAPPEAKP